MKKETLEERLLSAQEIDEKISELQKMKLLSQKEKFIPKEVVREYDFQKINEADVFDYQTFYEVSDIKNSAVYYLNGVQIASLFGMNEEYKRQFVSKSTNGQAQLDDKLVTFYYREIR